jgi:hypothetical protein
MVCLWNLNHTISVDLSVCPEKKLILVLKISRIKKELCTLGLAKSAIPSLSRASGRYSKDKPGFVPAIRYAREY